MEAGRHVAAYVSRHGGRQVCAHRGLVAVVRLPQIALVPEEREGREGEGAYRLWVEAGGEVLHDRVACHGHAFEILPADALPRTEPEGGERVVEPAAQGGAKSLQPLRRRGGRDARYHIASERHLGVHLAYAGHNEPGVEIHQVQRQRGGAHVYGEPETAIALTLCRRPRSGRRLASGYRQGSQIVGHDLHAGRHVRPAGETIARARLIAHEHAAFPAGADAAAWGEQCLAAFAQGLEQGLSRLRFDESDVAVLTVHDHVHMIPPPFLLGRCMVAHRGGRRELANPR